MARSIQNQVEPNVWRSLKPLCEFIAWASASVSGIGIVLTALGFIMRHAYLASLGVPRTAYESKASEYLITGGNFLLGLLPLAVVGFVNLIFHAWWLLLTIGIVVGLARAFRWSAGKRVLAIALLYGPWLGIVLTCFTGSECTGTLLRGADSIAIVAMLTSTVLLSTVYLLVELVRRRGRAVKEGGNFWAYLPLAGFVACGLLVLPYLRGAYATEVAHPVVEPLGPDRKYLDDLAGPRPAGCKQYDECPDWRLIERGENKVILLRIRDGSIVIIPADKLTAFRIIKGTKE